MYWQNKWRYIIVETNLFQITTTVEMQNRYVVNKTVCFTPLQKYGRYKAVTKQ